MISAKNTISRSGTKETKPSGPKVPVSSENFCHQIPANQHKSKLKMTEPLTNLNMESGFLMSHNMNKHNTRNEVQGAMI